MSRGHLLPVDTSNDADLLMTLEQEWKKPGESTEPILIEQPSGAEGYIRLYVLWAKWQSIPQQQRSRIIMESYKKTHSLDDLLNVTIAMGLTPDEAREMGLVWTTE